MDEERESHFDTHVELHGRPHERTMERVAFKAWIEEFQSSKQVDQRTSVWLQCRFRDELDRRRGLEHRWRKVFWLTRYIALSGALVLPVLITVGKSIFWVNVTGIVVSIAVALSTAMEALLRSGRKWRLYRQGADKMSSEGAAFFQELEPYTSPMLDERLNLFKARIEGGIQDLHQSYVADIDVVAAQNVISSSSDRPS
jgi:hypothetical protein